MSYILFEKKNALNVQKFFKNSGVKYTYGTEEVTICWTETEKNHVWMGQPCVLIWIWYGSGMKISQDVIKNMFGFFD